MGVGVPVALTKDGRLRMVALHGELHKRESTLARKLLEPPWLDAYGGHLLRHCRGWRWPPFFATLANPSTRKGTS